MQFSSLKISPCLWFVDQAEEAAQFYTSIFKDSEIGKITRYGKDGSERHQQPEGSVMSVEFTLEGQAFAAFNGGPECLFNEGVSFMVACEAQDELDFYWERLSEGSDGKTERCGWLKDKFGLSWQILPRELGGLLCDADSEKSQRTIRAMEEMTKPDIAAIRRAAKGDA